MPGALKGRAEIRDAFEPEASKARRDSLVVLVGTAWIGMWMAREGAVAGERFLGIGAWH